MKIENHTRNKQRKEQIENKRQEKKKLQEIFLNLTTKRDEQKTISSENDLVDNDANFKIIKKLKQELKSLQQKYKHSQKKLHTLYDENSTFMEKFIYIHYDFKLYILCAI